MKNLNHLPQMMHDYCDAKFSDKTIVNEVKTADLVIGDGMYQCSSLIADRFSIPHVTVLQSSLTTATATFPYNVASIPSYIPQITSRMTDNMNFFQRAENTLRWLVNTITFPLHFRNAFFGFKEKAQHHRRKKFGADFSESGSYSCSERSIRIPSAAVAM